MKHERWYDKNTILKQIMETLENIDSDSQNDIANDIIQTIVSSKCNVDNFIHIINDQTPSIRNRWYDKDETLLSAVEMLKNTDENEKKELLNEILTNILRINTEKTAENINIEDTLS